MNTMPEGNMAPRQGWWGRNWKWVVPVGCLTPVLMCGCFGALGLYFISSAIKSSDAYQQAVALVSENPEVQEVLGTPIEFGFPRGSVNTDSGEGRASLNIPVEGPKASGTLRVEALSVGGTWTFERLEVEVPGREPIPLMEPPMDDELPPGLEALPDEEAPPMDLGEEPLPPEEELLPPPDEETPGKRGSEIDL
ncbi:cytochrome c oxidase assembly factor 1 family protein [Stigmatella hybrida]|uniref:cytochrome c oxidase assembly factor 1 family protein n=1 Tax=Stigmatella hybrida TaxID=394097 RepID=UPI001CDAF02B|nr:cytochrome c oxidase assembly factor 1 family protein [Stigmatella hybrida]